MTPVPNKVAAKQNAEEAKSRVPAGARRPADHQSAKEDVEGPQDQTFEHDGVEYVVSADALDDAELLEHFTTNNFVGALMKLLGLEQWVQWKEKNRDEETGRVKASDAAKFLTAAMDKLKRKN